MPRTKKGQPQERPLAEYLPEFRQDALEMLGPAIELEPARTNPAFDAEGRPIAIRRQPWIKFGVMFSRGPGSMNARLSGGQVKTFIAIALRIDDEQDCWPSIETIATDSGQKDRTVQRHLYGWTDKDGRGYKGLVELGLVEVCQRPGLTNTYTVTRYAAYGKSRPDQTPDTSVTPTPDTGVTPPPTPVSPEEEPIRRTIEEEPSSSALRAGHKENHNEGLQPQEGQRADARGKGRSVEPNPGRLPSRGRRYRPHLSSPPKGDGAGGGGGRLAGEPPAPGHRHVVGVEYVDDPFEVPKPRIVQYIEAESRSLGAARTLTPSQQGKLDKPVQQGETYPAPSVLFERDPLFRTWLREQIAWANGKNGDGRKQTGSLISAVRNYERQGTGWLDWRQAQAWAEANLGGDNADSRGNPGGTAGAGAGEEPEERYRRQLEAAGLL